MCCGVDLWFLSMRDNCPLACVKPLKVRVIEIGSEVLKTEAVP